MLTAGFPASGLELPAGGVRLYPPATFRNRKIAAVRFPAACLPHCLANFGAAAGGGHCAEYSLYATPQRLTAGWRLFFGWGLACWRLTLLPGIARFADR